MINEVYKFSLADKKTIEKVVNDPVVMINHMVLPQGECLPTHHANSNVYMLVVKGAVTLGLDDAPEETFASGSIINIEYNTLMKVCNTNEELLEFFVVKAPAPPHYKG